MFEELGQTVEELEIPVRGDAIAEVLALADRLEAKISEAVAAFDAAGLWEAEGATSATAWLVHRGRLGGRAAASRVRTARRLRSLPVTSSAWHTGQLSGAQVRAITANLSDDTESIFAEHEADVVPAVAPCSVADTATAMRHWALRAEALLDRPEPRRPSGPCTSLAPWTGATRSPVTWAPKAATRRSANPRTACLVPE